MGSGKLGEKRYTFQNALESHQREGKRLPEDRKGQGTRFPESNQCFYSSYRDTVRFWPRLLSDSA